MWFTISPSPAFFCSFRENTKFKEGKHGRNIWYCVPLPTKHGGGGTRPPVHPLIETRAWNTLLAVKNKNWPCSKRIPEFLRILKHSYFKKIIFLFGMSGSRKWEKNLKWEKNFKWKLVKRSGKIYVSEISSLTWAMPTFIYPLCTNDTCKWCTCIIDLKEIKCPLLYWITKHNCVRLAYTGQEHEIHYWGKKK